MGISSCCRQIDETEIYYGEGIYKFKKVSHYYFYRLNEQKKVDNTKQKKYYHKDIKYCDNIMDQIGRKPILITEDEKEGNVKPIFPF